MRIRDIISIRKVLIIFVLCAIVAGPTAVQAATILSENFDASC